MPPEQTTETKPESTTVTVETPTEKVEDKIETGAEALAVEAVVVGADAQAKADTATEISQVASDTAETAMMVVEGVAQGVAEWQNQTAQSILSLQEAMALMAETQQGMAEVLQTLLTRLPTPPENPVNADGTPITASVISASPSEVQELADKNSKEQPAAKAEARKKKDWI